MGHTATRHATVTHPRNLQHRQHRGTSHQSSVSRRSGHTHGWAGAGIHADRPRHHLLHRNRLLRSASLRWSSHISHQRKPAPNRDLRPLPRQQPNDCPPIDAARRCAPGRNQLWKPLHRLRRLSLQAVSHRSSYARLLGRCRSKHQTPQPRFTLCEQPRPVSQRLYALTQLPGSARSRRRVQHPAHRRWLRQHHRNKRQRVTDCLHPDQHTSRNTPRLQPRRSRLRHHYRPWHNTHRYRHQP